MVQAAKKKLILKIIPAKTGLAFIFENNKDFQESTTKMAYKLGPKQMVYLTTLQTVGRKTVFVSILTKKVFTCQICFIFSLTYPMVMATIECLLPFA
jgi:hypothetical protein